MAEKWTQDEISNYQSNFINPELGSAYLSAGIPSNKPHERVEYLIEKLRISEEEKTKITEKMKEPDRSAIVKPSILNSLEKRVMRIFGIRQQFF